MSKNYTSILPVIHSNGTSAQQLYRDYCRAMNACVSTITAMQSIEFNGRDYYPLGDDAFTNARKERDQIITGIRAAFEYCLAHADASQRAIKGISDYDLPPVPVCYPRGDADTDSFTHEQEATRL